jgi:MFS family permease
MSPQTQDETLTGDSLQEPLLSGSNPAENDVPTTAANDAVESIQKDIVLPSCCQGHAIQINYNVFLNLVLAVLYGISNSLWNGTAYAAYLKKIGHGNKVLGDIEAVQGLASLIAALPMGYVADKMGRAKIIRAGGLAMLVTIFLQIGVLEWVGTHEDEGATPDEDVLAAGPSLSYNKTAALWMMGVIMAFWGIGDGVVNGPCNALFADSTPEGSRTKWFNYLFVCYTAASAIGPLVSIVLFQTIGDVWDLYHLRIVIYVGLGLEVFNSILMTMFDDRKALDENVEDGDSDDDSESETEQLPDDDGVRQSNTGSALTTSLTPFQKRQLWIPYIVFGQGLICAVGSGMTVKFFPLFFKDEVGMSPSQVQIIYCIVPLVMSIFSTLCTRLASSGFGRVQAMLLYSICGVGLLYSMVFCKSYLDVHPFLLVPVYILRTAVMNATYPIQESVLMDFVPKDQRARWKSLDSVASFGWCGSAAFGGWLADKFDYTYTFLITAILQSVGVAVWCLLLPLVPRKEGCHGMEGGGDRNNEDSGDGDHENNSNNNVADEYCNRAREDVAEMERLLGVTNAAPSTAFST